MFNEKTQGIGVKNVNIAFKLLIVSAPKSCGS